MGRLSIALGKKKLAITPLTYKGFEPVTEIEFPILNVKTVGEVNVWSEPKSVEVAIGEKNTLHLKLVQEIKPLGWKEDINHK
jgi:hypothetical protein